MNDSFKYHFSIANITSDELEIKESLDGIHYSTQKMILAINEWKDQQIIRKFSDRQLSQLKELVNNEITRRKYQRS